MTKDLKILIVEDESIVAMDLQHRLQNYGYTIVGHAINGDTAVKYAEEYKPDLILMDIRIKGDMDGIETAEIIKEKFNIPLLFLTAYADKNTLERAKVTEAFGYILKPYHERELYTNIEMAVYKHRMERKIRENEKLLNTTMNSISDGVVTIDSEGKISFLNAAAEVLLGFSASDAKGEDSDFFLSRLLTKDGAGVEFHSNRFIKRKNEWIPVETYETLLLDKDNTHMGKVFVIRDISERYTYEKALRQAKEVAERASSAKSNFLATVSHELRTPLNSILGMTDISFELTEDKDLTENLQIIHNAGNNLLSVINSILKFASLQNDGVVQEPTRPLSLSEIAEILINQYKEKVDKKGISFTVHIEKHTPRTVIGDESGLLDIFRALLENAIKFTYKGSVEVKIGPEPKLQGEDKSWLHFSVRDTGIGLTEEQKQNIFEPFTQGANIYTRSYGGTGLGLAIAKQKVEVLGGRIWVESVIEKGCTFHVVLPFLSVEREDIFDNNYSLEK